MATPSLPVFSSDGQPVNYIALLEHVGRNIDLLAASNPDAAKFITLLRRGFATVKGHPAVLSSAHATVLIRWVRAVEGTLRCPIPFCHVDDPDSQPCGAQFDPLGAERTTDLDAQHIAQLVALGGEQSTNDNNAIRDAAKAAGDRASGEGRRSRT